MHPHPLRKILSFNLLGGGVFLLFGVVARRGAGAGLGGDPVPQALVITGLVVAFAATALAVMLLLRLFQESGSASLRNDALAGKDAKQGGGPLMSTPDGFLLVLLLTAPVVGLLIAFVLGGRHAERVALLTMPVGLVIAIAHRGRAVAVGRGAGLRSRRLDAAARHRAACRRVVGDDAA